MTIRNSLIVCLCVVYYHTSTRAEWVKISQTSESGETDSDSVVPFLTKSKIFSDYVKTDDTKFVKVVKAAPPTIPDRGDSVYLDTSVMDYNGERPSLSHKLDFSSDRTSEPDSTPEEYQIDPPNPTTTASPNMRYKPTNRIQTTSQPIKVHSTTSSTRNGRFQKPTTKAEKKKDMTTVNRPTNAFTGFLSFLKTVQESIFTKSTYSISDKIGALKKLRDKLLGSIESRLRSLWPDKPRRSKRGFLDGDQGLDFPSAEAALMTINFLTFAVFLIKLVLQVINTIQSKHYNLNSVGTMEAIKIGSRRKRNAKKLEGDDESDSEKYVRIMNYVDSFNENLNFKNM